MKPPARPISPREQGGRRSNNAFCPRKGELPVLLHREGNVQVKVQIDPGSCQGHGRCYDLAPGLFSDDEEGYGTVVGDGVVPPSQEHDARRAALNCPEHAIQLAEGS
jgi:ferredoxin